MSRYQVASSSTIPAPPQTVYGVIADYRNHHPRIVPPEYFQDLVVTAGGVGAGTRTRFRMTVLGTTQTFEHVVSEPEPGRVLVETDEEGASVTTFTVDPSGVGTRLTIATDMRAKPGIAGRIEKLLTSMVLRRIYRKELARIAAYVAQRPV